MKNYKKEVEKIAYEVLIETSLLSDARSHAIARVFILQTKTLKQAGYVVEQLKYAGYRAFIRVIHL